MKTVSGEIASCQQVSLSRAAKYISIFTASDNEASPVFAAYLRHASAAFNEIVQLHKEYKIPLGGFKNKKDHSTRTVTYGTANSVKITGKYGLPAPKIQITTGKVVKRNGVNVDEGVCEKIEVGKKLKNKRGSDGDVGHVALFINKAKPYGVYDVINVSEVKSEIRSPYASKGVKNNLPDVGSVGKNSKGKRECDGLVSFTDNDRSHDVINVNEVKNEMERLDASEEMKKKKKKRDEQEKGNHVGALETSKEVQLRSQSLDDGIAEATITLLNNDDEQKKNKKSKVKDVKESCSVRSVEHKDDMNKQRSERNVENKDEAGGEKKHNKKQSYEAQVRENGHNIESEAAEKKAIRKRKHERVADQELDCSQEAVRLKKKKI